MMIQLNTPSQWWKLLFLLALETRTLLHSIPTVLAFEYYVYGCSNPMAAYLLTPPSPTLLSKQRRRTSLSLFLHQQRHREHWRMKLTEDCHEASNRRDFIQKTAAVMTTAAAAGAVLTHNPQRAWCRNLPESTGADLSSTGTVAKLIPLLRMKLALTTIQSELSSSKSNSDSNSKQSKLQLQQGQLEEISKTIKKEIPINEKQFKKIFDEYSTPVSYKQKYMDSNAFLIYYTNGFDGVGRDSIEKDLKEDSTTISKQTLQYGARNDVWNAFDEFMVELQFINAEVKAGGDGYIGEYDNDLLDLLDKVVDNFDAYLRLAPSEDIERAQTQLSNSIR